MNKTRTADQSAVTVADQEPAALFSPVRVGDLELPHRVVMAPMTRNRAGEGNVPREINARYYAQRASAALIVTEASQVSPRGVGYPATPGIHSDEQVAGWRLVTDAVHAAGGRIFLQLWHVGRISHPSLQPDGELPVAPSAIRPAGEAATYQGPQPFVTPRALGLDEIPGVVDEFRRGAANARRAGFDGVEVHAANGYLLDQFLRDGTNRREDSYGGSVDNRSRLLREVLAAVFESWPANRVGVRLSPSGTFNDMSDSDPAATFGRVVEQLDGLGLAYLHLIEATPADLRHGGKAVETAELRARYRGAVLVNGDYDAERGNAAVASGAADLVSFGRPFLANPDLPERLRRGAGLNEPDPATFYGGGAEGYVDYPALG